MFTRHIRKFSSSRQVKEAYLNGTLATPYIAFVDSSNNVEFAQEYYGTPPEVSYDKLSPYAWTSDYVPTEDASGSTVIEVTINQNSEFYTKLFPYLQVCYFYENERPEGDLDEFLSAHIVGTYLLDPFGSEVETYHIPYDSAQNEYPLNMYARFVDASVSADPVTGDDVYNVTASDGWKYISNYTGAEPEYDYYCTINNLTEDASTFIATATISISNGYYYGNYMKVMYGIYTAAELAAAQEESGFDLKTWQMTKFDSSVAVSPELEMTVTAQLPTPSAGEEIEGYMVCCPYNEDDQEYADIAVLPVAAWSVSADDEPVPVDAWWEDVDFSEVENIIEPDGDFYNDMSSSVDGINTSIVAAIANSGDVVLIINGTYENGHISGGRAVIGTVEPGVGDWEGNDYLEFADCSIGDEDTVYILGRYEDNKYGTVYFLSGQATSTSRVDTVLIGSNGILDSIYGPNTLLSNPATAWYENVDFSSPSSFNDTCEILYESGVSVQEHIEDGMVDFLPLIENASDSAVALVVNGEYDGAGHLTGGRRILGVIDDVNSTITFNDVYASEYDSLTLVIDMVRVDDVTPVDASAEIVYHTYYLVRQDEVGAFIGTKYQITQSIDSETGDASYAVSYVTTAPNVNRWSNFYADDQSGTMMFGNNFGISREDIDTTVFEAPQLQVAHFFKNEYDAVSDSSTFIFNEFLNDHSENVAIDMTAEGDINSTPFEYDSSTDEIPVTYWTRVTDASTDNATDWQDAGSFPDINVGYGNEHIDSDSSVLYISSSPSNDALTFGYTEARFGVWTNADYDASVSQGGMDETEFFIANMTLGPVNVENGYDASFNISEGHSEFIGQCYNPTTQEYWGTINHMYGFDFPIPFEFKTTFNDQTYVVDASAILSAGHINDGWTQYKYGWYDRSAWENDENGIQEQYSGDENAYRMANVQGTNSYSTTTFTCTADNSKSYKFSVFAIPYRLDGDGNDEHDWEYFREVTYDINM